MTTISFYSFIIIWNSIASTDANKMKCTQQKFATLSLLIASFLNSFIVMLLKYKKENKLRGLVRQRTIPTERPPLVGEVSTNFRG
jgi:hypothetical protein